MGYTVSGRVGPAETNGGDHLLVDKHQPTLVSVTMYCHSYPHANCKLEVASATTLRLYCDLRGIPNHAYTEIALELLLGGELKRFRHPVYVLEKYDETAVVAFCFEIEPELQGALAQLAAEQTARQSA